MLWYFKQTVAHHLNIFFDVSQYLITLTSEKLWPGFPLFKKVASNGNIKRKEKMNALAEALGSDWSVCVCAKCPFASLTENFCHNSSSHPTCEQLLIVSSSDLKGAGVRLVATSPGCKHTIWWLGMWMRAPDFLCPCALFSLSLSLSPPLLHLLLLLFLTAHLPRSSSTTCSPSPFLLSFCFPFALPLCYVLAALCFFKWYFSPFSSLCTSLLLSLLPPSFSLSFQSIPPPLIPQPHLRIPPYTPIASLYC